VIAVSRQQEHEISARFMNTVKKLYLAVSGFPLVASILLIRWMNSLSGDDWSAMIPAMLLLNTTKNER